MNSIVTIIGCFVKSILYGSTDGTPGNKKLLKTDSDGRLELICTNDRKAALVYTDTNDTIANSSHTEVAWDAEEFDTNDFWSVSPNPERLTIPEDGKYLLDAQYNFKASTVGIRGIGFYINGTSKAQAYFAPVNNTESAVQISRIFSLSQNDYVTVKVYQSSGGDLDSNGLQTRTWFSAVKVA